jgi:hypothetical protein
MANRSDCKSFVRAEPIFHSKFCIKTHPHHTKLLCSWGGGGGGGGGGGVGYASAHNSGLYASAHNHEQFLAEVRKYNPTPSVSYGTSVGHEHTPPVRGAPGPIAGEGIVGLFAAAIVVAVLYRRRKARA